MPHPPEARGPHTHSSATQHPGHGLSPQQLADPRSAPGGGGTSVPSIKDVLLGPEERAKADALSVRGQISAAADPGQLIEILRFLMPLFREDVASGFGPQFTQGLETSISRGNLRNTGLGETLSVVGQGIPGIEAFRRALGAAQQSQALQAGAFSNQAFAPQGGGDFLQRIGEFAGLFQTFRDLGKSLRKPRPSGGLPGASDLPGGGGDPFEIPGPGGDPIFGL